MGVDGWSLTAKLCDSCKTTSASVFCQADYAFLCMACDSKIHAANKVASRHARVWMCEVCEQAPATVTCKADSAALCATCDRDIHCANPLAQRHERLPVIPFYDSAVKPHHGGEAGGGEREDEGHKCLNIELNHEYEESPEEEEAEAAAAAASWLLPNDNPNVKGFDLETEAEYLFSDMDPYLDMDILSVDQKPNIIHQHHYNGGDGVVPVQCNKNTGDHVTTTHFSGTVVDGFPTYEMEYASSKPIMYNFSSQSISQSVSSSSLDVGVVPDHNAMADVSNTLPEIAFPNPLSGLDREARVLRYREKRKNRKFEKTIRYASRKAYAETRPRIKGRFAKRSEVEIDSLINSGDVCYGVVPSF